MSIEIVKAAQPVAQAEIHGLRDTVRNMLDHIATGREAAVRAYARDLDGWSGDAVVSRDQIEQARAQVAPDLKQAIAYAHDNIRRFARAQRETVRDMSVELRPGLFAGQRVIPIDAAGCYVPGGRYAHIASALMTITTAKEAGVAHITACSPPRAEHAGQDGQDGQDGRGIPAAVLYAMDLAGADRVLSLGGVQGIAAMAQGLFGTRPADILVGPGNAYVAEAKRQLFGPVGIDMVAGPTDVMILADHTAQAARVAVDLVSQLEHGVTSPVWLATTCAGLAAEVLRLVPEHISALPVSNAGAARMAWDALGEIVLCDTAEDMAAWADARAPEHLHVQAADADWWRARLRSYGSLFLGENTTVAFGDKAAGPNHVLPTSGAARHTGGLSVHTFLKTVTWQQAEDRALPDLARATATISRAEGMEGHALAADVRLPERGLAERGLAEHGLSEPGLSEQGLA